MTVVRHNLCPNPAATVDATGWSGSCSPSRSTSLIGTPRTTGVVSTASGFFQTPVAPCSPGQQFTVSFWMRNDSGSFQSGHTVYVSYTRSGGGDTSPETFATADVDTGQYAWSSFTTTIADVPSDVTGIYLIIDTMPIGIGITAVQYEPGSVVGSYFDGASLDGAWDGTSGKSASTYAPVGDVIFGTDLPLTTDNFDATHYTLGTYFELSADADIARIAYLAAFTANPPDVLPIQWQIWNLDTSTILHSGTFGAATPGEWNIATLTGVTLPAGPHYAVSIVTQRYCATTHYFDDPSTHGLISILAAAGRFVDIGSGTSPVMPTSSFNNGGYFIDIMAVPASAPPAGPTVSVWNGSAEVGATISVWNGTAEVPAVVDSVV